MNLLFKMRTTAMIAVLLAAAAAAGCASTSTTGGNTITTLPLSATIATCNISDDGCAQSSSFSLADVRDVRIDTSWAHVSEGTHTATIQVLEPGGGTYQSQNIAFAIAGTNDGSAQTSATIPFAGTWVTERQITGAWTIQVYLDGKLVNQGTMDVQL